MHGYSILKLDICDLSNCIIFVFKCDSIYGNVKYISYISLVLSFYCKCLCLFKSWLPTFFEIIFNIFRF